MGNRAIVSVQKDLKRHSYYMHWNGSLDTIAPLSKVLFENNANVNDFENFLDFLSLKAEKQKKTCDFSYLEENGHYLIDLDEKTLEQHTEKGLIKHPNLKEAFNYYLKNSIKKEYQEKSILEYWEGIQNRAELYFKKPEEIKIGTQFIPAGRKTKKVCTVTDILKTYNSKNELIKTRYVATHEFLGQIVKDSDVNATTIAIGLIK